MSIENRLKKLEQYIKPNKTDKTDLSHLTTEELKFLLSAFDNDNLENEEVQRLLSTIDINEFKN